MPTNESALTLYSHPLASYCWKVLVALYETGTTFRNELIEGLPKANPTLSALWPIGKMPVLHDAARDQAVPEATIIVEYLQQNYPGAATLIPEQMALRLDVRLWDRFFDLYVHTPMQKLVTDRMRPDDRKDPAGADEAKAVLDTAFAMLEQRMATLSWVAGGDFTLADCSAMPALFYAEAVHPFSRSQPALAGYFDRLTARPSARWTIRQAQPYFRLFPFHDALNPQFTSPDFCLHLELGDDHADTNRRYRRGHSATTAAEAFPRPPRPARDGVQGLEFRRSREALVQPGDLHRAGRQGADARRRTV